MTGWEPLEILSEDELRHVKAHYAGEVSMVDHHFGLFMDRLAASGRDKDTAVIVTCDHGTNVGAHGRLSKGSPIYEQVGHVVLMARVPMMPAGRRKGIVQPADIMPTILDMAMIPEPEACQGQSFIHALIGGQDLGREVAVSGGAIDVAHAEGAQLTVQDERWCLIDRPDPARRELYDKMADRGEEHDIVAGFPQEVERLHGKLLAFLASHEAHPALVQWFETGVKGDTNDYQHRPEYLASYKPYFQIALDIEVHR
jgi:arylsulfatase A-like enzyme